MDAQEVNFKIRGQNWTQTCQ